MTTRKDPVPGRHRKLTARREKISREKDSSLDTCTKHLGVYGHFFVARLYATGSGWDLSFLKYYLLFLFEDNPWLPWWPVLTFTGILKEGG